MTNWLKKLIIKIIIGKITKNKEVKKTMEKIKKWLEGKKSYAVIVCAVITGILQSQGIIIPDWVWVILASLFGITYKAGTNRAEQSVKDLIDEVKKANGSK